MNKKIFQIQISLKYSKPKIWRRLLIPSDLFLREFHMINQTAMGWEDSHLHQFIKKDTFYKEKMLDDFFWNDFRHVDYENVKVSDLLKKVKDKIIYEYDFGDSWEHDIILEKILPPDNNLQYPICLTGRMNCPPEDCGGIGGYYYMLEALEDVEHEEYEDFFEWLDGDFDPKYFNKNEVNKLLRK